jgi:hypothetical protein
MRLYQPPQMNGNGDGGPGAPDQGRELPRSPFLPVLEFIVDSATPLEILEVLDKRPTLARAISLALAALEEAAPCP